MDVLVERYQRRKYVNQEDGLQHNHKVHGI